MCAYELCIHIPCTYIYQHRLLHIHTIYTHYRNEIPHCPATIRPQPVGYRPEVERPQSRKPGMFLFPSGLLKSRVQIWGLYDDEGGSAVPGLLFVKQHPKPQTPKPNILGADCPVYYMPFGLLGIISTPTHNHKSYPSVVLKTYSCQGYTTYALRDYGLDIVGCIPGIARNLKCTPSSNVKPLVPPHLHLPHSSLHPRAPAPKNCCQVCQEGLLGPNH